MKPVPRPSHARRLLNDRLDRVTPPETKAERQRLEQFAEVAHESDARMMWSALVMMCTADVKRWSRYAVSLNFVCAPRCTCIRCADLDAGADAPGHAYFTGKRDFAWQS